MSEAALEAAVTAHKAALEAQSAMHQAARDRDEAVQAARAAGIPAAELATALGVNRHRIHAMTKTQGDKHGSRSTSEAPDPGNSF